MTSPEYLGGLLQQSWIFGIIGIVACHGCKERVIVSYRSVVDKHPGKMPAKMPKCLPPDFVC